MHFVILPFSRMASEIYGRRRKMDGGLNVGCYESSVEVALFTSLRGQWLELVSQLQPTEKLYNLL